MTIDMLFTAFLTILLASHTHGVSESDGRCDEFYCPEKTDVPEGNYLLRTYKKMYWASTSYEASDLTEAASGTAEAYFKLQDYRTGSGNEEGSYFSTLYIVYK